ncbi:MAG: hypothetical protein JXA25_17740 [Anaerolineales bacterium]|nr:hypothetical protein [Anaerolineales bacterium]
MTVDHPLTERLLEQFALAFLPIREIDSPTKLFLLMRELGYDLPELEDTYDKLQDVIDVIASDDGLADQIQYLPDNLSDLTDSTGEDRADAVLAIIENLASVIDRIRELVSAVETAMNELGQLVGDPGQLPDTSALEMFPVRFLDYLLVEYLSSEQPAIDGMLRLLGIIEESTVKEIHWDRIPILFTDPLDLADTVYAWGSDEGFEDEGFLQNLNLVIKGFGIPGGLYPSNTGIGTEREIRIPLYRGGRWPETYCEAGLKITAIPEEGDLEKGFGILPYIAGNVDLSAQLSTNWRMELEGSLKIDDGFGIVLRPPHELDLMVKGLEEYAKTTDATFTAGFQYNRQDDELILLLGTMEGSHFGLLGGGLTITTSISDRGPEFDLEMEIEELTIAINASDSDGFIRKILSDLSVKAVSDLAFGYSNIDGIHFRGSSALDIEIPIHRELGPIKITTLNIGMIIDETIAISAAAGFAVELGPITGAIDRIGILLPIDIRKENDGNLGPLQMKDPQPLLPTGVGFGMNATWVSGGGFLECDYENGLYSGALAIELSEIGVTAIGLITTKLPDGSDGFSMLVSICVTFEPAIQLYMGFTLVGVGGLIGVNRSMQVDVLREGLKKGTLDSILFPDPSSVIANVNQIISDMKSVFPAEEGRFVIGPMITLGWGTPTIITGEIGIFIAVPEPVQIVLLGQVEMSMPDSEHEIVGIHVDILGVVDFEKKELSLQAAISGSSLKGFELEGDCAFFLRWSSDQEFALSIGGFHPSFTPPAPAIVFDDLRRLGATIQYGPVVELQCQGYLALTPNSLQFGSRVGVFVGISEINAGINGFLSFDGMIIFSPFAFEVGMGGGVTISVGDFNFADIRISCTFSGPQPWNIRGTATVTVLFLDIDCGFDILWGESDPVTLETVKLWPKLQAALERAESWGSHLPEGASAVEALRPMVLESSVSNNGGTPETGSILVHPGSLFEIRQNVAPMDLKLDKIGNAPIEDYNRFKITGISTAGAVLGVELVDEYFARGQYVNLTNQQKLSCPSFEKLPGGVRSGTSDQAAFSGGIESKSLGYESILIQSDLRRKKAANPAAAGLDWSKRGRGQASGNAVRRGTLLNSGAKKFAVDGSSVVIAQEEQYVVVNAETLIPVELDAEVDVPPAGKTRTQAEQALAQQAALHPELSGKFLVVPEYEAGEDPPLHMELHQIVEGPPSADAFGAREPV